MGGRLRPSWPACPSRAHPAGPLPRVHRSNRRVDLPLAFRSRRRARRHRGPGRRCGPRPPRRGPTRARHRPLAREAGRPRRRAREPRRFRPVRRVARDPRRGRDRPRRARPRPRRRRGGVRPRAADVRRVGAGRRRGRPRHRRRAGGRARAVHRVLDQRTRHAPGAGSTSPHFDGMGAAEQAVLGAGVPALVLRPAGYLDNLSAPFSAPAVLGGAVVYPLPAGFRYRWVSHADQAALVAAALAAVRSRPGRGPTWPAAPSRSGTCWTATRSPPRSPAASGSRSATAGSRRRSSPPPWRRCWAPWPSPSPTTTG
jgi:uncharacterized protein YbjT (DUF2867 family)